MKKYFSTIILLIFNNLAVFSQTNISGKITDKDTNEIIGALISEINSQNKTFSDLEGNFNLSVSDSSLIKISFVGYKDTIIKSADLQDIAVILQQIEIDDNVLIIDDSHNVNIYALGYYADYKYMPYGISFGYFRPHLLKKLKSAMISSFVKTNFENNYNLNLYFSYFDLIKLRKYSASLGINYNYSKIEINTISADIEDVNLLLGNTFYKKFNFWTGVIFRKQNYEVQKSEIGYYFTSNYSFSKLNNAIYSSISVFNNYYEYSFTFTQGLSKTRNNLRNMYILLNFSQYKYYNELNFGLDYSISR
ncbi:MAG: carboxypeptidase-like regulatory domain-containing protein [Bacteroidales bacterium]|nr:carboxypeptidase-like regulatory domain-containing protein [Bacteroidales bacterium]